MERNRTRKKQRSTKRKVCRKICNEWEFRNGEIQPERTRSTKPPEKDKFNYCRVNFGKCAQWEVLQLQKDRQNWSIWVFSLYSWEMRNLAKPKNYRGVRPNFKVIVNRILKRKLWSLEKWSINCFIGRCLVYWEFHDNMITVDWIFITMIILIIPHPPFIQYGTFFISLYEKWYDLETFC